MKTTISFTDDNGITTELSVCAQQPALTQLFAESEGACKEQDLSDSFRSVLQEMPEELFRVHEKVCRSLLVSSCRVLAKPLSDES